jgi:DNA (cytosine-5)-methyltransferase 1
MTFLFPDLIPQSSPRNRAPRRRKSLPGTCVGQEWPLEGKINVVLFAGMGGACQGMEEAGYPVHIAVNHDEIAIAAHKALNPHTKHLQADIYEIDPLEACGGRAVGLLWASPDCRDHSVAKGGAPRSPRVRSMPWQVCRWVGRMRKRGLGPDVVFLENVREIRGWAALVAKRDKATGRVIKLDGTVAAKGERVPVREQQLVRDPKRVGGTYRAWVKHMEGLGATWEDRDLCCADFGVPTSRKRLWGVAHFDGAKAYWGPATNGHRNSEAVKTGGLLPHSPAADFIDWSLPLPSIFDRKKPLAPATLKRVAVGMKRFVLEAEKPFLIHLTHQGTRPAMDVEDAGATLTGAHRGEVAVVAPLVISPNHTASYYDYFRGHGAGEAAQTMTQNMGHALVGASLIPTTHSKSPPRVHDGAGSAPTFTAAVKGGELAAMAATVIGVGGRAAQMGPIDVAGPLNTSTTKEDRCVVAA